MKKLPKRVTLKQLRDNLIAEGITWADFSKTSSKRVNHVHYYARIDKFLGRWSAAVLAKGRIVAITFIEPNWSGIIDNRFRNERGGYLPKHHARGQFHKWYGAFAGGDHRYREQTLKRFLQLPVINEGAVNENARKVPRL